MPESSSRHQPQSAADSSSTLPTPTLTQRPLFSAERPRTTVHTPFNSSALSSLSRAAYSNRTLSSFDGAQAGTPLSPPRLSTQSPNSSTSAQTRSHAIGDPQSTSALRHDTLQRNDSMDSSSVSSIAPSVLSQGHSPHSSSETAVTSSSPPDAASLVSQAAGNPHMVIDKLLKENRALSSRNEQLWRLVEKQRGMVHGLHADLERALKDKERYRRRVKEYQQQEAIPAIPRNPAVASEIKDAQRSRDAQTPAHGKGVSLESVVSSSLPPQSPKSPRGVPHQVAPSQSSTISTLTEDSQTSSTNLDEQDLDGPESSKLSVVHPASSLDREPQQPQLSSPSTPKATRKPSLSSPGEKARKAAPAPLNLATSTHSPASTDALNTHASMSDYGDEDNDVPARIEIPEFERGRRRTREDDDREREMIAMAEEARSRSEKSKKSKSKPGTGDETPQSALASASPGSPTKAALPVSMGLPSSPKVALPPGHIPAAVQPPSDSIASILAPSEPPKASPPQTTQNITLPPKSPGLPMSPKPSDRPANAPMPRAPGSALASPGPISPRQGLPLSPRAPKYPIPLPPSAPGATLPSSARQDSDSSNTRSMAQVMQQKPEVAKQTASSTAPVSSNDVYRGFVTEQYPGLLVTPNALPHVIVKVWSSRLRPATNTFLSKGGDDDGVFSLGVHMRSTGQQLWRVEKKPATLSALDHALRKYVKLGASSPGHSMFSGHAPAKVDARRAALNRYFETMLETPMEDKTALIVCDYFSKDTLPPEEQADLSAIPDEPNSPASPKFKSRKEGYLAKKGKQFGGWKSRYFILDNAQLKHFESPGGAPLGIIKLQQAQIARPNAKDLDEDDEFRHAFMILEPKRKDSSSLVRHVLCAESDEERDVWVEALVQHINGPQPVLDSPPGSPRTTHTASLSSKSQSSIEFSKRSQRTQGSIDSQAARELQSIHYEDTVALNAPKLGTPSSTLAPSPSPLPDDHASSSINTPIQHPAISGPVAGGPIQNASSWGNKSASPTRAKEKDIKKRSMFGFIRSNPDEPHSSSGGKRGLSPRPPAHLERRSPARAIFGTPLAEAAEYSQPTGINICIPSPVYRCIEYLEANHAAQEEGIFRLSGSNTVIRNLKDRFDVERDVNLLEGPYIDIHAVASLLKLYLRELPDTILTRDKVVDFQKVLEVEEHGKRLAAINLLIHQLPEANREVLVALSRYLIQVVNNSETNRMTIKNIGIVFAPTLNIPNPLVFLFITDFDSVFTAAPADPDAASPVLESIASFKAENPQAAEITLAETQMQNIAASTGSSSHTAANANHGGSMPSVQQRINELHQHSPKTSQNSFTEHLAEQRQQIRQVSSMPREGSPGSARAAAYGTTPISRRQRQSPSPASRAYQTSTPQARSTPPPPPGERANGDQTGNGSFAQGSPASSSPSSLVSSVRGRDSPSMNTLTNLHTGTSGESYAYNNAAATVSRKARRESAMLGSFNGNTNFGATEPSEAAKRKSSYNRLRDNMTNNALREE